MNLIRSLTWNKIFKKKKKQEKIYNPDNEQTLNAPIPEQFILWSPCSGPMNTS